MVPEPRHHEGALTTIPSSKKAKRRTRSIELPPIKKSIPKFSPKAESAPIQNDTIIDSYANRAKAKKAVRKPVDY